MKTRVQLVRFIKLCLLLGFLTACSNHAVMTPHTSKKAAAQPLRRPVAPRIVTAKPPSTTEEYIYRFLPLAISRMRTDSIPASITLAQGILESASGKSYLARKANNHFGIKVTSSWKGQYVFRQDDKPDDKFRKYNCVEQCFEDHAKFLKRSRYASLFKLKITDYKGWARGLQACGYATSKSYATRLIRLIEHYKLNDYDEIALSNQQVYKLPRSLRDKK